MKFLSKNSMKKTAIILVFLTLFSFMIPNYSNAGLTETLVNPIKDLIIFIGDGVMSIMQGTIMGDWEIKFSTPYGDELAKIKYNPEKIFNNEIALFDVNFFEPKEAKIVTEQNAKVMENGSLIDSNYSKEQWEQAAEAANRLLTNDCYSYEEYLASAKTLFSAVDEYGKMVGEDGNVSFWEGVEEWWDQGYDWLYKLVGDTNHMNSYRVGDMMNIAKNCCSIIINMDAETGKAYFDNFGVQKEAEGKTSEEVNTALSFFYYKFTNYATTYEGATDVYAPAFTLRKTIAKWYTVLKTIALVGMLSILVYIGIRILFTTVSKDKAKYKQMLIDWLVAMCLLFFMHYIMAFSVSFVEKITELINYIDMNDFMNIVRNHAGINNDIVKALGYTVMYIVLIVLTISFTFTYIRRVIYMAFLTMISPLVAFTYPIDKVNDGQAQAFNMWLKEYIFTLLIQPMHLLLYTILMGSAVELAKSNIIYALVVLAFMTQAEKIVRRFFGFEKAQGPGGFLQGPGGAALTMQAINALGRLGHRPPGHGKFGGKEKKDDKGSERRKPYFSSNINAMDTLKGATADDDTNSNDSTDLNRETPFKDSIPTDEDTENYSDNLLDNANGFGADFNQQDPFKNPLMDVKDDFGDYSLENSNRLDNKYDFGGEDDLGDLKSIGEEDFDRNIREYLNDQDNSDHTNLVDTEQLGSEKPTNETPQRSKPRRVLSGVGNVAKMGLKASGRFVKKAAPKVAGGFVAGTLGTIGLAAGIASGDASKVAQYATIGTTAGYALGQGATKRFIDGYEGIGGDSIRKTRDEFQKGYYDKDEYRKKEQDRYIKEYIKKNKAAFSEKLGMGTREAEKVMKDGLARKCIQEGIDDIDDIATIYDIEHRGLERKDGTREMIGSDMAIAITKLRDQYGVNPTGMTKKTRKELNDTGVTDDMISYVERVNKHKKKL